MNITRFDYNAVLDFISEEEIALQRERGERAFEDLVEGRAKGSNLLGWLHLPKEIAEEDIKEIISCVKELKERTEVVVVIGIGGSYLGSKAVIEALSDHFMPSDNGEVIFAGHQLCEDYFYELRRYLLDKEFGICVISKSGTTMEPAIAFRLLRKMLEEKSGGEEACKRIITITDSEKGALYDLAVQKGYKSFVIPDNVGGRFSVLTPVGLLPIALSGLDIRNFVRGAVDMQQHLFERGGGEALDYAAVRNALYNKGYTIEITVNYSSKLHYVIEWWKQLYGESEGKGGKGIFPAGADFTTDLHSMGQYIQDGPRNLFETVISIEKNRYTIEVPSDEQNMDKLNYLAGKRLGEVNKKAEIGTRMAHVEGGVPNMRIILPELSEYYLGALFYFYELACGISGGILGLNAFDQPGVEAYKKSMFKLLGKPE